MTPVDVGAHPGCRKELNHGRFMRTSSQSDPTRPPEVVRWKGAPSVGDGTQRTCIWMDDQARLHRTGGYPARIDQSRPPGTFSEKVYTFRTCGHPPCDERPSRVILRPNRCQFEWKKPSDEESPRLLTGPSHQKFAIDGPWRLCEERWHYASYGELVRFHPPFDAQSTADVTGFIRTMPSKRRWALYHQLPEPWRSRYLPWVMTGDPAHFKRVVRGFVFSPDVWFEQHPVYPHHRERATEMPTFDEVQQSDRYRLIQRYEQDATYVKTSVLSSTNSTSNRAFTLNPSDLSSSGSSPVLDPAWLAERSNASSCS